MKSLYPRAVHGWRRTLMKRRGLLSPRLRRWMPLCFAGLPMLSSLACVSSPPLQYQGPPTTLPAPVSHEDASGAAAEESAAPVAKPAEEAKEAPSVKQIPISLDTVLRLAEEQNAQVGLARARVAESYAAA